ncbi:hypothetical protein FHR24_001969 [Wenyingzhuangia heitensis]|uniref:Uncharacterized protein n=1 Tax=Wenyingzhuangia heitensis TaxID=1487859 RepID=A0ABX0UD84_9FLAO|nr:DUF6095 family protein [Wenyingzhuangia heitensis]NIJ45501.1 hypothetical protein [Wenyingzhuangia heitensis]
MENQDPKKNLRKGINLMGITLTMLIFSPLVINIGFKAQQKGDINFILYIGIALAIGTIILFALGIRSLLKHLFRD